MNIDGFIKYLENQERAYNTIESYKYGVKQFFEKYTEVSQETVLKYKKWLMDNFKPKTVNIRLSGIMGYCAFIGVDVKVKGIKVQKALSVENVITPDEFTKLTDALLAVGDERNYWLVTYLAKTGARASEFVRLTKAGLRRGYEEMFTKGKVRRIYFPAELIKQSSEYFNKQEGELLFPSRGHIHMGKELATRSLAQILKTLADRHGIRK